MHRAPQAVLLAIVAIALGCTDGAGTGDGGRRDTGGDGLRFNDRGASDGPVDAAAPDVIDLAVDALVPDRVPLDLAPLPDLRDACVGSCAGRQCGDDGCGRVCGSCGAGQSCVGGQCTDKAPQLVVSGAPEVVWTYDGATFPCAIADGPVRLARDSAGRAMMFIQHAKSYRLQSTTVDGTLQLAAGAFPQLVYQSPQSVVETAYESRMWISSLWSDDGTTFRVLAHHEWYYPSLYSVQPPEMCLVSPSAIFGWVNAVHHFVSTDGGASFAPTVPYRPALPSNADRLAVGPETFIWQNVSKPIYPAGEVRYGFFRPSNVAKVGTLYYVFVGVDELVRNTPGGTDHVVPPRRGLALLRTADIASGWSNGKWQIWDGGGWATITGLLPLGTAHVFTHDPSCAPPRTVVSAADPSVAGDVFALSSSLTYSNVGQRWLLLGHAGAASHVAYTTIADLAQPVLTPLRAVAGSDAVTYNGDLHPWTRSVGSTTVADWTASYPALADPTSAGKVYMYTGAAPHLYYVRSKGGVARDVYRVSLNVTMQ